jgi:hypothetical protein
MLEVEAEVVKLIVSLDDVGLEGTHPLIDIVEEPQRTLEDVCVDAEVIEGVGPYRMTAYADTDLAQMLHLRGHLGEWIEGDRTDGDLTEIRFTEFTDPVVVLVKDRNRIGAA